MLPAQLQRNPAELEKMRQLVESGSDCPVLMLNVNTYTPEAGYPDGEPYREYVAGLTRLVESLGGELLWHLPVLGQPVGAESAADEIIAIWYPSHKAYLEVPSAPGGEDNYRLRRACVQSALIHRCAGNVEGVSPAGKARALVHEFFAAVTAGELPDGLLTPDMTAWTTMQGKIDKSTYQDAIRLLARITAGPLAFTIHSITVEGDRAVAEARSHGTLIDGADYENTYMFVFTMRGGRIASVAEHFNALIVKEKMLPVMKMLERREPPPFRSSAKPQ